MDALRQHTVPAQDQDHHCSVGERFIDRLERTGQKRFTLASLSLSFRIVVGTVSTAQTGT